MPEPDLNADKPQRIVIAAPECVPFIKVGGLADVVGALARVLAESGHLVTLVIPKVSAIDYQLHGLFPRLHHMGVATGHGTEWCKVHHAQPQLNLDVYFIEHHGYFSDGGVYDDRGDEGRRFVFFSLAVLQLCRELDIEPDVLHVHDWPTAIIPALLKYRFADEARFAKVGTLLTIHNLAHQGHFPAELLSYAGIPWAAFRPQVFEDHGNVNLLKGGLHNACILTTVSPTYAWEITTPEGGAGLHGTLETRLPDLHGILNGVDDTIWDPERDLHLPARFSCEELTGKAVCKQALQRAFSLDVEPETPVFGVVSRLVPQKGIDLIISAASDLVQLGGQLVLLGSGDTHLEGALRVLEQEFPGRVGVWVGFDEHRAHLINGGSDFLLMSSRFEPCGLSQIYALRYGTLPIVRRTGGLADTVWEHEDTRNGTGYLFDEISPWALLAAIRRAVDRYRDDREVHDTMIQTAMRQRFEWSTAAEEYLYLYTRARHKRAFWTASR